MIESVGYWLMATSIAGRILPQLGVSGQNVKENRNPDC